ncbi:hypothetical protein HDU92_006888, partial [Lobulomyces angularis]
MKEIELVQLKCELGETRSLIWNSLIQKKTIFDPKTSLNQSQEEQFLIRSLPTLILYDDKGLDIFDQITYNDQYYLTDCEIEIFKNYGDEMAGYVKNDSIVVELGVGAMRKTRHFLNALIKQNKTPTYYAIDLEEETLRVCLESLAKEFPTIKFVGLVGLYEKGLEYIAKLPQTSSPKILLWMGSSIGNMTRPQAVDFFKFVHQTALVAGDLFFVGQDGRNDPKIIAKAYNDDKGVTREFIMNGLDNVNVIFKEKVFDRKRFEYVSIYNAIVGRHEAYYRSLVDQTISVSDSKFETVLLQKGELINVEYSYKYNKQEIEELAEASSLMHTYAWFDSTNKYGFHMYQKPKFFFPRLSQKEASSVPTLSEFQELWKAWDTITSLIKDPYALADGSLPFIHYLGKAAAFSDLHISQQLATLSKNNPVQLTEPSEFVVLFSRGLITNGCETRFFSKYPDLNVVKDYDLKVRQKITSTFENNSFLSNKNLLKIFFYAFENQSNLLEKILNLLINSSNFEKPNWIHEPPLHNKSTTAEIPPSPTVAIEGGSEVLGLDFQNKNGALGWDLESPERTVTVSPFQIQNRPVSVGEYFKFLKSDAKNFSQYTPSNWKLNAVNATNEEKNFSVNTIFGSLSLTKVWDQPVSCTYNQANAYAQFVGMRIPSEVELFKLKRLTEEAKGTAFQSSVNVGFSNWLPADLDFNKSKDFKDVSVGGNGWELTSSVWNGHPGYEPSEEIPGVSADFKDGNHNLIFGGSWCTHPKLALRKTFKTFAKRDDDKIFTTFRC